MPTTMSRWCRRHEEIRLLARMRYREPRLLPCFLRLGRHAAGCRREQIGHKDMATGQITRLLHDQGFGFVQPAEAEEEILFYRSTVEGDSLGQRVEFDQEPDPREPGRNRAIHVRMWEQVD